MGDNVTRSAISETRTADQLEVGDEFAPFEVLVTPELNQQYLYAEEDFDPRYWRSQGDLSPLVHPALLLHVSNNTHSPSFRLPRGIVNLQTAEETAFMSLCRVGARLRVTWVVVDRFERRGRTYNTRLARVVDQNGTEILRRTLTGTFVSER
jgi:hypothetical protein